MKWAKCDNYVGDFLVSEVIIAHFIGQISPISFRDLHTRNSTFFVSMCANVDNKV